MPPRSSLTAHLRRLLPLAGLLILCGFFAWKVSGFIKTENLFNIARQQSIIMLIAFGMTLVVIAGQIDLSVGSVAAFSGMAAAWLMNSHLWHGGVPVELGITGGVLVGALWGIFNAIFVGIFKLPSFVVTLGTMGMAHGLALMVSETAISVPDGMRSLAEGMWLGLPVPLWLILLTALFCSFLLRHTTIGRAIYAVGGNATAARFSGIDERKPLFFVFAMSGALTGLAGMIEVARLSSAQPTTGESYPLDAIAAVVIGGGSLFGGEGAVIGTVIGALVIAVLRNGLDLMSVQPFTQMVIIGALVIVAVALDQWRRRP